MIRIRTSKSLSEGMTRDLSGMQYARSYVSVYEVVYGPRYEKSNNTNASMTIPTEYTVERFCLVCLQSPKNSGIPQNSVLGFDK